jgi:SNARE associated Golgi protein
VAACGWLVATDAPAYQFLVRLYVDKRFLKYTLREWGGLAPVIFMGLQALQVIIAPIPGELTGILGGYLFGQWAGHLYSTIGLTVGSVAAFAVGRWLGARYVQKLVSPGIWRKMGFIVEAGGHPLLHHLLDSRPPEGHEVLPLRAESYAVLDLYCGLEAGSYSGDLASLGARCSDGVGRLSPGDLAHGHRCGGGIAAVLLPEPRCRMVSRETNQS